MTVVNSKLLPSVIWITFQDLEFEVHKNGVKQIVPAPSTAVEDSNLVIGHNSNNNIHYIVGGYLISKGLTGTEISLFSGAWNTLIAKIGRI